MSSSVQRLRDGRGIGLLDIGAADGTPVFFFHGFPASRLEAATLGRAASEAGVRLVGLDRPGVGLSSPRPGYDFLDWPADVAEVADGLGIDRFSALAFSGGAPFALACAVRVADRLHAIGLLSSALPPGTIRAHISFPASLLWWGMERTPAAAFGPLVDVALGGIPRASEDDMDRRLVRTAPRQGPADQKALADPVFRRQLAAAVVEGYRQGPAGHRRLAHLLTHRWSFAPEAVALPKVFLWHGEQDPVMPVAGARRLAAAMPQCRPTFFTDEGHLSPLRNRCREILAVLARAAQAVAV